MLLANNPRLLRRFTPRNDSLGVFCELINLGEFAKNRRKIVFVIPTKVGIQQIQLVVKPLDPGFHRGDDYMRVHQFEFWTFEFVSDFEFRISDLA
jgi:hypothetical protein